MKSFVLFLCLMSSSAFAQVRSSYFLYEDKKIKVDDRSFKRYILPQLRAITQEYYHILRKLNPVHDSTIKLYLKLSKSERLFKTFARDCRRLEGDCLQDLKDLYGHTRELDYLILKPQDGLIDLKSSQSTHEMEGLLQLISSLGKMSNDNYRLMHALEEYILTANTSYFPYYDGRPLIEPTLHKMLLSSELMITQLLESKLRADFHAAWMHFFKDIDQKVLYEEDKNYLIKRLEELNLAWNTFHMKMTKGNHNLPKNIVSLIKIMHNRWNSCLKIILR